MVFHCVFDHSCERIIKYDEKIAPLFIRDTLYSYIPAGTQHIIVAGIGSNIISGDSLGPFVGTLLFDNYEDHLMVIGTLENPLDAVNLPLKIAKIYIPDHSFIIAIDSVLGSKEFNHTIVMKKEPLQPGAGLGNQLPPIGDCSIMGVVHENAPESQGELLYTNLHFIYAMASTIAKGISLTIRQYFKYPADHPILTV